MTKSDLIKRQAIVSQPRLLIASDLGDDSLLSPLIKNERPLFNNEGPSKPQQKRDIEKIDSIQDQIKGPSRDQVSVPSRDQVGTKSGPSQKGIISEQEIQILQAAESSKNIGELMKYLGWTNRTRFRQSVISPLLDKGWLAMTHPENPRDRRQRYVTTDLGRGVLNEEKRGPLKK